MKKRSLKKFQLKKYKPSKDDEGNVVESYEKCSHEDVALIWPSTSKLQVKLYGMRVSGILNMHYYGSLAIKEHDMIIYEDISYKVISIQNFKRFKAIEIERL
jgi:hypothetical protein